MRLHLTQTVSDDRGIRAVATNQPVIAQEPYIAELGLRLLGSLRNRILVRKSRPFEGKQPPQFLIIEAGEFSIKTQRL